MYAVAATAYIEPVFTEDLDIAVLVDSDGEYLKAFGRASSVAEQTEGMHLFFDGTLVQMFPTTTKLVYRDALEKAKELLEEFDDGQGTLRSKLRRIGA